MKVRLVISPADDPDFGRDANAAMRASPGTPDEMQSLLRAKYRSAVVRNGVTDLGGWERWYVYRDGHWTPPADGIEADT